MKKETMRCLFAALCVTVGLAGGGKELYDRDDTTNGKWWAVDGATDADNGPRHYERCRGTSQTPIELPAKETITGADAGSAKLTVNYTPQKAFLGNNGHGFQVYPKDADWKDTNFGTITVNEIEYTAVQFHFHFPSEHYIGNTQAAGEVHIVHTANPTGANKDEVYAKLAVIGLFIEENDEAWKCHKDCTSDGQCGGVDDKCGGTCDDACPPACVSDCDTAAKCNGAPDACGDACTTTCAVVAPAACTKTDGTVSDTYPCTCDSGAECTDTQLCTASDPVGTGTCADPPAAPTGTCADPTDPADGRSKNVAVDCSTYTKDTDCELAAAYELVSAVPDSCTIADGKEDVDGECNDTSTTLKSTCIGNYETAAATCTDADGSTGIDQAACDTRFGANGANEDACVAADPSASTASDGECTWAAAQTAARVWTAGTVTAACEALSATDCPNNASCKVVTGSAQKDAVTCAWTANRRRLTDAADTADADKGVCNVDEVGTCSDDTKTTKEECVANNEGSPFGTWTKTEDAALFSKYLGWNSLPKLTAPKDFCKLETEVDLNEMIGAVGSCDDVSMTEKATCIGDWDHDTDGGTPDQARVWTNEVSDFYRYSGSLTTPPCYETVNWFMLDKRLKIDKAQIDAWKAIIDYENNREIMPLGTRTVYRDMVDMAEAFPKDWVAPEANPVTPAPTDANGGGDKAPVTPAPTEEPFNADKHTKCADWFKADAPTVRRRLSGDHDDEKKDDADATVDDKKAVKEDKKNACAEGKVKAGADAFYKKDDNADAKTKCCLTKEAESDKGTPAKCDVKSGDGTCKLNDDKTKCTASDDKTKCTFVAATTGSASPAMALTVGVAFFAALFAL